MLPFFDHGVLLNSLPLTTTANADPLFGRGDVIVKGREREEERERRDEEKEEKKRRKDRRESSEKIEEEER
jgi:hypothetical protein